MDNLLKWQKILTILLFCLVSIFCHSLFERADLGESLVDSIKSTDGGQLVGPCRAFFKRWVQFTKNLLGVLCQVCGIFYIRGLQCITLIWLVDICKTRFYFLLNIKLKYNFERESGMIFFSSCYFRSHLPRASIFLLASFKCFWKFANIFANQSALPTSFTLATNWPLVLLTLVVILRLRIC